MKAGGITIDHYNGLRIDRPCVSQTRNYDFDFRKSGDLWWRYLNSADTIEEFNRQIAVNKNYPGFEYRIVDSHTLEIVKTNIK
jgi:hypothetical protein